MPERYLKMSEEEYRNVVAEWCMVNRAFSDSQYVNSAKGQAPASDPNKWREKKIKERR